jgi:hypothetical protein
VGHRPLQQYLVETENGRLQVLDLAWDVTAKKWFHLYPDENAPPGDGMHWTGSYKNWQARCAACHQTGFDKGYDFPTRTYQTHWKELTVGCESCHGPGSEHIDWARSSRSSDNPHQSLMPKLGPGQQENELNVCGPCHARRDAFSQLSPPAGSPFAEHYALSGLSPDLYFADGQQNAEVFILGSFLQSKMKAKGVTCSDCHDGHSGALVAEGNAVCTQCHSEAGNSGFPSLRKADYDTPAHHHHEPGSEAAQCVSCHMPERSYMVIDPRRDHFFRKPDPLQAKAAGAPDACTSCHTEKTAEWAAAAIKSWAPESDYSWQDRSAQIAFQSSPSEKTAADLVAYARNLDRPALVRASAVTALGALSAADAEVLLKDPDEGVRTAAAGALRALEPQQRIALHLGQEHTVGHQLDDGVGTGSIIEADLAAHFAAPGDIELFSDTPGDGQRRHPPGLCATDHRPGTQSGFQAHLRNLGRLARSGLAGDDHDLMSPDRRHDVLLAGGDGQPRRILRAWHRQRPVLAAFDGAARLLQETIQRMHPISLGPPFPHPPCRPRPESNPVG